MSTAYAQGAKRQKVRERDNVDYFQGIDKVEYNNMSSATDSAIYRHYSGNERVHSRAMDDWLKFSVSLTEFRSNGSDSHGKPTHTRPWDDKTNTMDNHKRCIKALFDFCSKLGVKFWTAFDSDLIPLGDNLEENKTNWDDIVEYIQELGQRFQVKLLWIAPDLHSHPRYSSGALTSNDATTFVQAATQIKRCLEASQRLNAECFLIWPYREGYNTIFQTDVSRELKLFAKLLKITAEYKDRLNYRCQLLIMPYYNCNYRNYNCNQGNYNCNPGNYGGNWRESEIVNKYMWDVTSCLYLLKNYNLDRYYKVCSVAGHQLYMASVYNMLGGITVSNDLDSYDNKQITLMMKCLIDNGTAPHGGIHLKLSAPRDSDLRELVTGHVRYMDALARGLRVAASLVADQIFSKHLQQRYTTYYSGFGARLMTGDVTMEECEEYHKKNPTHGEVQSSRCEHFKVVFQRYLDACDHV